MLGGTLDLELINAEELIIFQVLKVNQFESLTTATTSEVLIHAEVLG